MEILNILENQNIVLIILIALLFCNISFVACILIKDKKEEKKQDLKEIEELENSKKDKEFLETEKIQDEKVEKNKKEVEDMLLKMQRDLNAKPEDVVANFETEQEEKSIISYQELLKSVSEKNNSIKATPVKIEEEKIDIDLDNTLDLTKEDNGFIDNKRGFKNTDFISPIFGIQENTIKYPTVPKINREYEINEPVMPKVEIESVIAKENVDINANNNIIDTSSLKNEIKKNDDFLASLKEFRKNLNN